MKKNQKLTSDQKNSDPERISDSKNFCVELSELKNFRLSLQAAAWVTGTQSNTFEQQTHISADSYGFYSMESIVGYLQGESVDNRKKELEIKKLENLVRNQDAQYLKDQGLLVDREHLRERLGLAAQGIRNVGDNLARKGTITGTQAQALLNNAIKKLARDLKTI